MLKDFANFLFLKDISKLLYRQELLTKQVNKFYKHIYYLAEIEPEKYYDFCNNNLLANSEIGDMGFYTLDESIQLIRDYHVEKKSILHRIMNYYTDLAKKENDRKKEEWIVEND